MKKINKTLSKDYLAVKVFLDELEAIERILNEECRGFKIETDDYEFSSVKELYDKYKNQKLYCIKIFAHEPYVQIELRRLWVRLYCGSDEIKGTGIFHKIDLILLSTLRKPTFLYSYWVSLGVMLTANLFLVIFDSGIFLKIISALMTLFAAVWYFWAGYIRLRRSGEVILAKKWDMQDFYARNKDQFILIIFSALISAIITAVVAVYFSPVQKFLYKLFE